MKYERKRRFKTCGGFGCNAQINESSTYCRSCASKARNSNVALTVKTDETINPFAELTGANSKQDYAKLHTPATREWARRWRKKTP